MDIAQVKTLPGDNAYAMHSGPSVAVPPAPIATPRSLALAPSFPRPPATIRSDGAFDPGDDDTTSTTLPRR